MIRRFAIATEELSRSLIFRFLFKVVFVATISLSLLSFSPFGIKQIVDRYSQDLFNTWFAEYTYPAWNVAESELARNDYSVLLINENTLSRFKEGWPLSPDSYARIFTLIWSLKPQALFVDIQWISMMSKAPGIQFDSDSGQCINLPPQISADRTGNLYTVLRMMKRSNIAVFVSVTNRSQWCRLPPEIRDLVVPVAVDVEANDGDFVARSYPLYGKQTPSGEQRLPSAALALCDYVSQAGSGRDCLKNDYEQIDVFWGMRNNPDNSWMQDQNNTSGIDYMMQGLLNIEYAQPYATTLFIQDLLNPLPETNAEANNHQEIMRLKERLKGRVVFLGAQINGVDDFIFTPTRQVRPGIYYHAMAFDNLVSWGDSVTTRVNSELGDWIQYATVMLLTVITVWFSLLPRNRIGRFLLLRNRYRSRRRRALGMAQLFLLSMAYIPVSFLIAVLAIYINSSVLNLPAAYWLGYLGLIMLGVFIGKIEFLTPLKKYLIYLWNGKI